MDEKKHNDIMSLERRQFLKNSLTAGSALMASPLLAHLAFADEKPQQEVDMEQAAIEIEKAYMKDPVAMRALEAAKAIAKQKKGIELTIFMPAGAVINFMPFTKIWEKETGSKLRFF